MKQETKPMVAQKWFNIPLDQREKLFSDYHYSFPDILAKRTWDALGKREKEIIKHYLKYKN